MEKMREVWFVIEGSNGRTSIDHKVLLIRNSANDAHMAAESHAAATPGVKVYVAKAFVYYEQARTRKIILEP